MDWINGNKTYIVAAVGAIVTLLWYLGVITQEQATAILVALGFGGMATLKHGQQKTEQKLLPRKVEVVKKTTSVESDTGISKTTESVEREQEGGDYHANY